MTTISSFCNRLNKLGINVELIGNYPWVYLDKVNGVKIKTKYLGNHGFTIFFKATKLVQADEITNIPLIFKTIREVIEK
jgi:hypothetical protein